MDTMDCCAFWARDAHRVGDEVPEHHPRCWNSPAFLESSTSDAYTKEHALKGCHTCRMAVAGGASVPTAHPIDTGPSLRLFEWVAVHEPGVAGR